MPPARWSCSNCGIVNKASTTVCVGCGNKCLDLDTGQWDCRECNKPVNAPTCPTCQYRKPLPKDGIPQIFEGCRIVFTGIIPRSIPHWSEWKEWQQAEQRGGVPLNEIGPTMTHLVYKEGFERSDKVRKTQKMGMGIKIVCSEWFHQSVNLGVLVDEDPYNLTLPQKKLVAANVQGAARDITSSYIDQLKEIAGTTSIPPSGTGSSPKAKPSAALTSDGNFMWLTPPETVQPLFQDCTIVFSPKVPSELKTLARAYSAKESKSIADADATHYIAAPEDEKSSAVKEALAKNLSIATTEWIEHCVQLNELLPSSGPYEVAK